MLKDSKLMNNTTKISGYRDNINLCKYSNNSFYQYENSKTTY